MMKYAVYHSISDTRTKLQKLEWTTTPPTEPGWYQAVANMGVLSAAPEFVEVVEVFPGNFWAERTGNEERTDLTLFTHWLGPIPLAERPTE
jgi:hypothetical protein